MLDVILYRHDPGGMLHLMERKFADLPSIAYHIDSCGGQAWDWAEVHAPSPIGESVKPRICRLSAYEIRELIPTAS